MSTETKTTGDVEKVEKVNRLMTKLELFLNRACRAEEKQDYFKAGRCFALALLCEGQLLTDGKLTYTYVLTTMPVY